MEVKLTIVRRGVNEPLFFTVKRDKIPILSLDAAYMIQPRTGYIRINRFGATTAEEFLKALKSCRKRNARPDTRFTRKWRCGYLNAAIDLANEFLQQKTLLSIPKAGLHAAVTSMQKEMGNLKTAASSFGG